MSSSPRQCTQHAARRTSRGSGPFQVRCQFHVGKTAYPQRRKPSGSSQTLCIIGQEMWLFWDEGFLETGNSKVNTDRSSPRQHSFISRSPTALLLLLSGRAVLKEKVTRKAWIGSSELISEMKSGRDLPQRVYFLVCTARVEMMRQQCGGFKIRIEDTSIDE